MILLFLMLNFCAEDFLFRYFVNGLVFLDTDTCVDTFDSGIGINFKNFGLYSVKMVSPVSLFLTLTLVSTFLKSRNTEMDTDFPYL